MKKIFLLTLMILQFITFPNRLMANYKIEKIDSLLLLQIYYDSGIDKFISIENFSTAVERYNKIDKKVEILTMVDFKRPSDEKRFFVIDMANRKLLFSCHVAHGRNSGERYATDFSNVEGSLKSSLGFYLTSVTYMGANGYSLKLHGLDRGKNDNAYKRYVVVHPADYADPKVIKEKGRLGRSEGCLALPPNLSKQIINVIKAGSVIYVYNR